MGKIIKSGQKSEYLGKILEIWAKFLTSVHIFEYPAEILLQGQKFGYNFKNLGKVKKSGQNY